MSREVCQGTESGRGPASWKRGMRSPAEHSQVPERSAFQRDSSRLAARPVRWTCPPLRLAGRRRSRSSSRGSGSATIPWGSTRTCPGSTITVSPAGPRRRRRSAIRTASSTSPGSPGVGSTASSLAPSWCRPGGSPKSSAAVSAQRSSLTCSRTGGNPQGNVGSSGHVQGLDQRTADYRPYLKRKITGVPPAPGCKLTLRNFPGELYYCAAAPSSPPTASVGSFERKNPSMTGFVNTEHALARTNWRFAGNLEFHSSRHALQYP